MNKWIDKQLGIGRGMGTLVPSMKGLVKGRGRGEGLFTPTNPSLYVKTLDTPGSIATKAYQYLINKLHKLYISRDHNNNTHLFNTMQVAMSSAKEQWKRKASTRLEQSDENFTKRLKAAQVLSEHTHMAHLRHLECLRCPPRKELLMLKIPPMQWMKTTTLQMK